MSEFKNTSSESKIVLGSIVHPGNTIQVDDPKDHEVEGIAGMEKQGGHYVGLRGQGSTPPRKSTPPPARMTGGPRDDDDFGGGA
jgi:hypothetical protein